MLLKLVVHTYRMVQIDVWLAKVLKKPLYSPNYSLRRCDHGASTTVTSVPMRVWAPFFFGKLCPVKSNNLISIPLEECARMTSQPLVKKWTAPPTTRSYVHRPQKEDHSTARFSPSGHYSTELLSNDGLSRRSSSRRFREWSQCHVWWISVEIYYVFRTYLKNDDEWDSLVSKSGFYVKFGVGIGLCSYHFGENWKISDLKVV